MSFSWRLSFFFKTCNSHGMGLHVSFITIASCLLLFVYDSSAVDIMPELKRNILNFGYGVNYKYEGMLSHSFDRFYIVTHSVNYIYMNYKTWQWKMAINNRWPLKASFTVHYLMLRDSSPLSRLNVVVWAVFRLTAFDHFLTLCQCPFHEDRLFFFKTCNSHGMGLHVTEVNLLCLVICEKLTW